MQEPALNFLYDDGVIFALDKPSGVHSVALRGKVNASIARLLLAWEPSLKDAAQKPEDAGLINRLDYETSGLLLGAHTRSAWEAFSKLLKSGEIKKSYHVLLEGKLLGEESVKGWLGSPNRGAKKIRVYASKPRTHDRALPAASIITPERYDAKRDVTTAHVKCDSARRHQVRAHCAFIGHPLTGDSLYGSKRIFKEFFPNVSERDFFLHAATAEFKHPVSGKEIKLVSADPIFRSIK